MLQSYVINNTECQFININYKFDSESNPKGEDGKNKADVSLGESTTLQFFQHLTIENIFLIVAGFDIGIAADVFNLNLSVEIKMEIESQYSDTKKIVKLLENEFESLNGDAFNASIEIIDKHIIRLMELTPNKVQNNFGFLKTYFELNLNK